ncbi:MlaD family protein [uncultured Mucilaginibacter sp.]|uniref:MlaD family protein n=1 Tax=uncultured Mucilaginibacter sp. TaxID=797541 RepID=UPI0025EB9504|nr:MlaD family protein [uncultured Mucilaginibacter sp.]
MKTTIAQKFKIGIFTLTGIVILFIAIFLIGSQKNLFSSTYRLSGMFKNVGGLQVGNNVRLAGINVGVVDDIELITDSTAKVSIILNTKYQKFIKTDARLAVGSDGFIGDKLINISPGGITSQQVAQNGQQLGTVPPFDTDKLIARATVIIDNAANLTGDLSQIVNKINNGKGSIGRLLNNDKMAKDMKSTVNEAKSTMSSVRTSTGTLNQDLKAAQSNFLLKGFFKKKAKAKQDSIDKAKAAQDTTKKKKKGFLGLGKG